MNAEYLPGGDSVSDRIDIGYIDHLDENFDYSYVNEPFEYTQICKLHHCVSVPGAAFQAWAERLPELPTCFCSAKHPGMGVDACGVTLIPPTSLPPFLSVMQASHSAADYDQLLALLNHALDLKKYVICFGI